MSIDFTVDGSPKWNANGYSVAEDATPVDPSDATGGVSQFTINLPESESSVYARGAQIDLSDGSRGKTTGTASGLSGDGSTATITADSRLIALNVTRTAQPFAGTLKDAILYYMGLCGVVDDFVFDLDFANPNVAFIGWTANVWLQMKGLGASFGFETTLASNNIVLRPFRQRDATLGRFVQKSWGVDGGDAAQAVEIAYYQPQAVDGGLIYPLGNIADKLTVLQLAAGETTVTDVALSPNQGAEGPGASLTGVIQPVCVDSVNVNDIPGTSVYSVVGADGKIFDAATWTAQGGKVSVEINGDTSSIIITATSGNNSGNSPYQIAMPTGDGSTYVSSLRILGSGIFTDKRIIKYETGLSPDRAPTGIGATVDLPFIATLSQATNLATWVLSSHAGGNKALNITATGINRKGDTGQYSFGVIADLNALEIGKKAADWNTEWVGKKASDFNAWWKSRSVDKFENQAFGNVGGARIRDNDTMYRIRSVGSFTPADISFTAEADTIAADHNKAWSGRKAADFNAFWAGKKARDYNATPLRVS